MQRVTVRGREPDDHIYLDVNLFNNSAIGPTGQGLMQYIPAEVNLTRDQPYLNTPEFYNLAVVRFAISSSYVPRVFQVLGTTGGNTTWYVGLSYNGVYYTEPIVLPTILNGIQMDQQVLYNVNAFLDVINAGYLAAQTAAQVGGAPTGSTGAQPLMTYDPVDQLYTMNVPTFYGTGTTGATGAGIGVHMSFPLYQEFQSFNFIQNSPLLYAAGNNSDVTFVRELTGFNYINNTIILSLSGTGSGPYMQLKQDASWASTISNINRLQITSNQLPVVQEFVSTTTYLQEEGGPGNQIFPILTDFLIGSDSQLQNQGQDYLYFSNLYRITTLQGSTPLRSFSLKIYVTTHSGLRFPLFIPPYGCMCLKLLFLKKGLTN